MSDDPRPILVTGASGFLGGAVVSELLKHGQLIRAQIRRPHARLESSRIEVFRADLSDPDLTQKACRGCRAVIHTAARTGIWGQRTDFIRDNLVATRNILRACEAEGIRNLVYTSSPSVVFDGRDHQLLDERAPYARHFLSAYPWSKALAEREVLSAHRPGQLHCIALRPHLIWGPGDPHLIPRLIDRARSGRLRQVGRGDNQVDMVHIRNAASAHRLALESLEHPDSPAGGRAYFITNGEPILLWPWIRNLLKALDLKADFGRLPLPLAYAAGAVLEKIYQLPGVHTEPPMTRFVALQLARHHTYDISAAKRDLGYQPKVSMSEGLEELIASSRN